MQLLDMWDVNKIFNDTQGGYSEKVANSIVTEATEDETKSDN